MCAAQCLARRGAQKMPMLSGVSGGARRMSCPGPKKLNNHPNRHLISDTRQINTQLPKRHAGSPLPGMLGTCNLRSEAPSPALVLGCTALGSPSSSRALGLPQWHPRCPEHTPSQSSETTGNSNSTPPSAARAGAEGQVTITYESRLPHPLLDESHKARRRGRTSVEDRAHLSQRHSQQVTLRRLKTGWDKKEGLDLQPVYTSLS